MKENKKTAELSLQDMAKPNCSKCFGKGYTGQNIDTGILQICKCVKTYAKRKRQ